MSDTVMHLMMNGIIAIGTWPTFGILLLLCSLFFGYLVPKTKAPIFAHVPKNMPHSQCG